MKVVISPELWASLDVDNHELFVRSAFFLGYSILSIKEMVRSRANEQKREYIIETARLMGLSTDDEVMKRNV